MTNKKSVGKFLLAAVVVDPMGTLNGHRTREQEIQDWTEQFSGFCSPIPLRVYTPDNAFPGALKSSTDLVLYDFGGMTGTSLMSCNARHLIRWAQDNPSALIVVVSEVTFANYVKPEAESLGLNEAEIYNIVVHVCGGDPIPEWFKHAHSIVGLKKQY